MPRKPLRPDWVDLLWINGVTLAVLLLAFLAFGCGTGGGNPAASPIATLDFNAPADEYAASDAPSQPGGAECGSYGNGSASADIDAGRQCIRTALAACNPARYLLDRTNSQNQRFASFVEVEGCTIRIHTVSEDPSLVTGDQQASCTSVGADEMIELACGIGG